MSRATAPRGRERSRKKANGCYVGCVCVPCLAENAGMTLAQYKEWARSRRNRGKASSSAAPATPAPTVVTPPQPATAPARGQGGDGCDLSPLVPLMYRSVTAPPTMRVAYQPEQGQAQFYVIQAPERGKWRGWIFVKHQLSDELHRAGSQRPDSSAYRGDRDAAMRAVLADPEAAMRLYGRLIEKCAMCGRTLTNQESREYGIGPECRKAA